MSKPEVAPKGKYEETGEFRPPKEGEFYYSESTGVVLIASYGMGEKRKIVRLEAEKESKRVSSDDKEKLNGIDSNLEGAAKEASKVLSDYMNNKVVAGERVRTATQTLQIYAKLRAVSIAEKAFIYQLVKDTATDKFHLKKLIDANIKQLK